MHCCLLHLFQQPQPFKPQKGKCKVYENAMYRYSQMVTKLLLILLYLKLLKQRLRNSRKSVAC
ncbi:DUF2531 family protein [Scytonema tolypothrichoides VB-61278]|nr:DUF2531 family protein [Scytonema tolypothrichoides VB-61278]